MALTTTWGVSSAGRASDCLSECQGFDPPTSRQDSSILAQTVEQQAVNLLVPGSIPGDGAIFMLAEPRHRVRGFHCGG